MKYSIYQIVSFFTCCFLLMLGYHLITTYEINDHQMILVFGFYYLLGIVDMGLSRIFSDKN